MPGWHYAHARDESESVQFAYVWRHLLASHCQTNQWYNKSSSSVHKYEQNVPWSHCILKSLGIFVGADLLYSLSQRMTKPTKWHVRPAKTQISLGIRPVWLESSLCAQWVKVPSFLHADSEDWSDLADVQADQSLRWADMPFCWFCHALAHFLFYKQTLKILTRGWCGLMLSTYAPQHIVSYRRSK